MNTIETIILFFSILSFFLGVFFLSKKSEENMLFGVFLILFAYSIFYNVLYWSRISNVLLINLKFTYLIPFSLFGPIYYFYLRKIIHDQDVERRDVLHFIPLLAIIIVYGSYFFLKPSVKQKVFTSNNFIDHVIYVPHFDIYILGVLVFYTALIIIKFKYSFVNDKILKTWLKLMTWSFCILVFFITLYYILVYTSLLKMEFDYFITFIMIIIVAISSYYSFKYPSIFNGADFKETNPFIKYERSGLSEQFSLEMKEKLLRLMEHQKPYLQSDLRLGKLCKMLDVSRNHASQIINEHFNTNFFDFINTYRIQEAEKLLLNKNDRNTIEDVLYQSGFNNKVSFYNAFRKIHNMTPKEYISENGDFKKDLLNSYKN